MENLVSDFSMGPLPEELGAPCFVKSTMSLQYFAEANRESNENTHNEQTLQGALVVDIYVLAIEYCSE